jgi:hypothetical protein
MSFQMPIPDSPENKPAPLWMRWVTGALLLGQFAEYFYLCWLWMQQ